MTIVKLGKTAYYLVGNRLTIFESDAVAIETMLNILSNVAMSMDDNFSPFDRED